jgi:hypothetical protein
MLLSLLLLLLLLPESSSSIDKLRETGETAGPGRDAPMLLLLLLAEQQPCTN